MNQLLQIQIPNDLRFSDLHIARDSAGNVSFSIQAVVRLCEASGIDASLFLATNEDNLSTLLTSWYEAARRRGEPEDPVMEDLIAEARAEDEAGQPFSHPPGSA